jgi:hypothetical protein
VGPRRQTARHPPGHTEGVESALFAPDGSRILIRFFGLTARLWDRDGKPLATLEHTSPPVVQKTCVVVGQPPP